MKTLIREVIRIENAENKNGDAYRRAILHTKKGESKLPLFGELGEVIMGPGKYNIKYDDSVNPWKIIGAEYVDSVDQTTNLPPPTVKSFANASITNPTDRRITALSLIRSVLDYMGRSKMPMLEFEKIFDQCATKVENYADKRPINAD